MSKRNLEIAVILIATLSGCCADNKPLQIENGHKVDSIVPARKLIVVEGADLRQWIWDGGEECGSIWGDRSPYLAFRGTIGAYFVRKQDASRWVEQKCPNAVEVKP